MHRKKFLKNIFAISLDVETYGWSGFSKVDYILAAVLAVIVLFTAGSLYCLMQAPQVGEKFTEFYILGASGKAEGYPRQLKTGAEGTVIMGIVNHEYQPAVYTAEVCMEGDVKKNLGPYVLKHEEKWEVPVSFSTMEPHDNLKVEFILHKDDESEPYRSLCLWVTFDV